VNVRWSSTDIMIEQALLLHEVWYCILLQQCELQRHQLSNDKWTVLCLFHETLCVPHVFQQKLSAEKTPTLCDALPLFSTLIM
ncbi:hypothetical protein ARMGADRAFT_940038, partial [Armillaria gallica]